MIRVNLLGVAKAKKRRARAPVIEPGGGMVLGLLIAVIVIVAGIQWYRYGKLQQEGRDLDQQVQRLTAEKAELAQVQAQYDTFSKRKELLQARINIIEQLKANQAGPVILLNTLANSVNGTEQLWLTGFQKTGAKVNVSGVALSMRAVADFMTRLQASHTFKDVSLKETAQQAGATTNFTFTVETEMAPLPVPSATANAA